MDKSTEILQKISMNFVSKDQLRQLRLIFSLTDLAHQRDIEEAKSLLQFKKLLLVKWDSIAIPMAMIQSMLMIIEVNKAETQKLCTLTKPSHLQDCEKTLRYPQIIIEFCKGLKAEEFESIKGALCENVLECSADNIENCEELCLKLHQQQKISDKYLKVLVVCLRNVGRHDIAQKLQEFTEELVYSIEVTQSEDGLEGEQTTSLQLKDVTKHTTIPRFISKTVFASPEAEIVQSASTSISAEQSTNSLRSSTTALQQGTNLQDSDFIETQNELQVSETNSRNDGN